MLILIQMLKESTSIYLTQIKYSKFGISILDVSMIFIRCIKSKLGFKGCISSKYIILYLFCWEQIDIV